jgi:hypothetical protein
MSVTMPGCDGLSPTSGSGDASCPKISAAGEAAIMLLMGGDTSILWPHTFSADDTSSAWGTESRLISLTKLGKGEAEGKKEGGVEVSSTTSPSASPRTAGGESMAGGATAGESGGGLDGGDKLDGVGCRRSTSARGGEFGGLSSGPSGK